MGILYEHWRTDTNECFYVGASWVNPETRPYEMNRSGEHLRVQEEVKAAGGSVEVRLIECSHLSDDELDELETLQISYWKDLIGERLVNKSKGGRTSWGFCWPDESKRKYSEFKNTKEELARSRDVGLSLWADPEYVNKVLESRKRFMALESYRNSQKEKSLIAWSNPELIEQQRQRITLSWSSPDLRKEQSIRSKKSWEDPVIRKKRTEGLNRSEVVEQKCRVMTGKWVDPEFRFKMLYRDWYNSVKRKPYWGA
jgi:hypothetical protein